MAVALAGLACPFVSADSAPAKNKPSWPLFDLNCEKSPGWRAFNSTEELYELEPKLFLSPSLGADTYHAKMIGLANNPLTKNQSVTVFCPDDYSIRISKGCYYEGDSGTIIYDVRFYVICPRPSQEVASLRMRYEFTLPYHLGLLHNTNQEPYTKLEVDGYYGFV